MRRRTFDALLTSVGLVLAIILLVAGGLLTWASSFIGDQVKTQLSEGGAIAGGTAHLLDVVRTTVAGGVPLVDAVRAASTTPATVPGDSQVGALEAGCRADVVITDSGLRVVQVMRAGTVVHSSADHELTRSHDIWPPTTGSMVFVPIHF